MERPAQRSSVPREVRHVIHPLAPAHPGASGPRARRSGTGLSAGHRPCLRPHRDPRAPRPGGHGRLGQPRGAARPRRGAGGFARANFGDDDGDGLLPWVAERLEELAAEAPPLFDEGDGIDFEAVAASAPDVILAAYSGLSRADYETLSEIAPVVPYREAPWATDWREMIRLNGAAMGMAAEGEALIGRIEGEIAETVARHPEIRGRTAMFATHLDIRDLSVIRFYSATDTRVKFFEDLAW